MTTFSHSRLASFEDCPRKFKYRYILKIPTETEGIEGYGRDETMDLFAAPGLVVRPRSTPEVQEVLRTAERESVMAESRPAVQGK